MLTKVIEGDDGYYVVRLDKMLDEDATENKEKTVISERKSDLYDSTLQDWAKEEKIKVDDKVWDQIKYGQCVFEYKSTDSSKGDSTATDADSTKDTEDTSAQDSSASDSAAEDSAE